MTDEILDLVDENDYVIGQISRDDAWATQARVRVVNAFVVNSLGQLWIPRLTSHKKSFPNCLDVGVGGHVQRGESYLRAFRRETQEELNIDLDQVPWRKLAYFSPLETTLSAFMEVFEIQLEQTPGFNPEDFSEFFWLTPQEAIQKIHSGDPAKGDLLELIERLYPMSLSRRES
jgi:isopentenyldiphosphate isomerase